MVQAFENECKVLLNSEDYSKIYKFFDLEKSKPIQQVNYYFDTLTSNLVNNKYNLRVRHIIGEDTYTLTIKIPQENGSNLEINEEITFEEFNDFINYHKVPNGYINDKLKSFNKEEIVLLTSLCTTRYEFEYNLGALALDYNEYNDKYDYELEFEGKSMEHAIRVVNELFNLLNIECTFSTISKRKRAIDSIK